MQNHEADIVNRNKGTTGTNETYDKNQGNRGKQMNPTWNEDMLWEELFKHVEGKTRHICAVQNAYMLKRTHCGIMDLDNDIDTLENLGKTVEETKFPHAGVVKNRIKTLYMPNLFICIINTFLWDDDICEGITKQEYYPKNLIKRCWGMCDSHAANNMMVENLEKQVKRVEELNDSNYKKLMGTRIKERYEYVSKLCC
jgi:hypothetical protein